MINPDQIAHGHKVNNRPPPPQAMDYLFRAKKHLNIWKYAVHIMTHSGHDKPMTMTSL